MRSFRELTLDPAAKDFMIGAELVTTRGSLEQPGGQKLAELGDALAGYDRLDWISITDNAGGNPMLAPTIMGRRLMDKGKDVIVHLTCKDRNRNGLESAAWQLQSEGMTNILVLTGDYPIDGYRGIAQPVFDLDSVTLTMMLGNMNEGLKVPGRKPGTTVDLDPTNFFLGGAVSPFKNNEAEVICQYRKLELKHRQGLRFIIPQLGYDGRKSHELIAYLRRHGMADVPVFGNIYLLTKTVAGLFNKKIIPGCTVSDKLMARITEAAKGPDKGKSFFTELAAKQYAIFKGLGYRGAYFGGFHKIDQLTAVLELADTFGEDDWKEFARDTVWPQDPDFYLYAEDPATGLANPDQDSPEMKAAADQVDADEITLWYRTNRMVHSLAFDPHGILHKPVKAMYKFADDKPTLSKVLGWQERVAKKALFDCQDCGDCSLMDICYMCPGSDCKKNQRNGPCGGSRGPLCEVVDVNCIWYRAYHRAKKFGELDGFLRHEPIVRNHSLKGTSSWANYFLGRDHQRLGAEEEAAADEADKD